MMGWIPWTVYYSAIVVGGDFVYRNARLDKLDSTSLAMNCLLSHLPDSLQESLRLLPTCIKSDGVLCVDNGEGVVGLFFAHPFLINVNI